MGCVSLGRCCWVELFVIFTEVTSWGVELDKLELKRFIIWDGISRRDDVVWNFYHFYQVFYNVDLVEVPRCLVHLIGFQHPIGRVSLGRCCWVEYFVIFTKVMSFSVELVKLNLKRFVIWDWISRRDDVLWNLMMWCETSTISTRFSVMWMWLRFPGVWSRSFLCCAHWVYLKFIDLLPVEQIEDLKSLAKCEVKTGSSDCATSFWICSQTETFRGGGRNQRKPNNSGKQGKYSNSPRPL